MNVDDDDDARSPKQREKESDGPAACAYPHHQPPFIPGGDNHKLGKRAEESSTLD